MNKSRYLMASSLGAALTIVAILAFIFATVPDNRVTTSPVGMEDDYYLRGSIDEISEGKKVSSNTKDTSVVLQQRSAISS